MKVRTESFKDINGSELVVKSRKSAVILQLGGEENKKDYRITFKFDSETFKSLLNYLEEVSNESWVNVQPKECQSFGSDYEEYYDRDFDNNGYLSIQDKFIAVGRPVLYSDKLYQFNKKKMESFLYDFKIIVGEE